MQMRRCLIWLMVLHAGLLSAQSDSAESADRFSVITIARSDFRIYSEAYLLYRFTPGTDAMLLPDTTSFQDRFLSHDYCRTARKQVRRSDGRILNASFAAVNVRNRVSDGVCFRLTPRGGTVFSDGIRTRGSRAMIYSWKMTHLMPEMRIYLRYDWMVAEPMTRREFRRMMRKQRWYDVRILHEEGDEVSTMILKGAEENCTLTVYPFRNVKSLPEMWVRPDPDKLYSRYARALSREEHRFNTRIVREMRLVESRQRAPREFMPVAFFSPEEHAMTREEWFEYVMAVMSGESQYILDAPFSMGLLVRYLELNGYVESGRMSESRTADTHYLMQTPASDMMTAVRVIFVDKGARIFCGQAFINRSIWSDNRFQSNYRPHDYDAAFVLLADGTLLFAERVVYEPEQGAYVINGTLYDVSLLTIGIVAQIAGL